MLISQSGARKLLPRYPLKMMRTGFRKLYSLRLTSHDFENNRAHGNESVTTKLESDILCTQVGPVHVLDFNSMSHRNYKSSKKPLLIVEASLKIF